MQEITLKQLVKYDPDYLRLFFDPDTGEWKLYASIKETVKVLGKPQEQESPAIVSDIKIGFTHIDRTGKYAEPTQLNFHYTDADTLKTLLAHYPQILSVEHYPNSLSTAAKKWAGLTTEVITIKGRRWSKDGLKVTKENRVSFTTPSFFGTIAG